MIAIDTNVLVYALDADEPIKQPKAVELLRRLRQSPGSAILLWQVAAELLSVLRKRESKGRVSADDVESSFRRYTTMFPVIVPGPQVFATYFALHARFKLSHWDSMLLAACKEAGVTTLYSEDMDAGTDYDGLAIVNPFA